jgi:hypothetical protein
LQKEIERFIPLAEKIGLTRQEVFSQASKLAAAKSGKEMREFPPLPARATIPYLTEPWYC